MKKRVFFLTIISLVMPASLLGMAKGNGTSAQQHKLKASARLQVLTNQISPQKIVSVNATASKKMTEKEVASLVVKTEKALNLAFKMGSYDAPAYELLWKAIEMVNEETVTKVNYWLLCKAIEQDHTIAAQLSQYITKDTFLKMPTGKYGAKKDGKEIQYSLLTMIIAHDIDFLQRCYHEFVTADYIKYFDGFALELILDRIPECAKKFPKFIELHGVCGVPHIVLKTVYFSSEDSKKWVRSLIAESIQKIGGHEIMDYILMNPVYATRWFAAIGMLENDQDCIQGFQSLFTNTIFEKAQFWKQKKDAPFTVVKSATSQHALLNWDAIGGYFAHALWKAPELRANFFKVLACIGEEQRKGRYPFIHAQKGHWALYQDIFKELWQIYYNEKVGDDYWFFRFDKAGENMPSDKQKTVMKHLIGTGWRRSTLYMNYPLFGSTTVYGSSSVDYLLKNHDFSSGGHSIRGLFEVMGFEAYYDAYVDKFSCLEKLFKKSSSGYGTTLVVSLSLEQVQESVRAAKLAGAPQDVFYTWTQSSDIMRVLNTFDNTIDDFAKSDWIEFFAVLADGDKGLLNPHNPGIRTYDFRAGDFTLYKKCLKKLFTDIAQEIAHDREHGGIKKTKEIISDRDIVAQVWKNRSQDHVAEALDKKRYYKEDCKKYKESNNSTITKHDPKNELRVMTYNVHFFNDSFGLSNVPAMFKNIEAINPDVVCLQEFVWRDDDYEWGRYDSTYLQQKFAQLGYVYGGNSTFALGHAQAGFGNIIFSKYPLENIVKKTYSLPNGYEKRSFVGATVMFNNKPVRIYTTHLDVWDESGAIRIKELYELEAYSAKHDKDVAAVLITGDFNAVFESDYQYKVNNKLAWDLLKQDDKSRGIITSTFVDEYCQTLGYQDAYQAVGKVPAFTSWSGKVIDKGFLRPGAQLKFKNAQVYMNDASDHLPVFFDLVATKTL